MKQLTKNFVAKLFVLAAGICMTFTAFFNTKTLNHAHAAGEPITDKIGYTIELDRIPSEAYFVSSSHEHALESGTLVIPRGRIRNGSGAVETGEYPKATLIDSRGNKIIDAWDGNDGNEPIDVAYETGKDKTDATQYEVTLRRSGYYRLSYSYGDVAGNKTQSEVYTINVVGEKPTLEFFKNVKYTQGTGSAAINIYPAIPDQTSKTYPFVLPIPQVLDSDGEVIDTAKADIIVKGGAGYGIMLNTGDVGNEVKAGFTSYFEKITVKDSNNNNVETYRFKPQALGMYEITYTWGQAEQGTASETFTVTVRDDDHFDPVTDVKLTFTFDQTRPTTAVIGRELKLPSVTARSTGGEGGDYPTTAYTDVQIYFVNTNGTKVKLTGPNADAQAAQYADISEDFTEDFTFTPLKKGLYAYSYQIFDCYGNKSAIYNYSLENVKDNEVPVVMAVKDYDDMLQNGKIKGADKEAVEANIEEIVANDASYLIPSKVEKPSNASVAVTFPAIFATDNYSEVNFNSDATNAVELTRVYRLGGQLFDIDAEKKKQDAGYVKDLSKAVTLDLSKTGEYTVEYRAKDNAKNDTSGQLSTQLNFVVNVVDAIPGIEEELTKMSFEISGIPLSARPGKDILFAKPTATSNVDARVHVETYYTFAQNPDALTANLYAGTGSNLPGDAASIRAYMNETDVEEDFRKVSGIKAAQTPKQLYNTDSANYKKSDDSNHYLIRIPSTIAATDNLYVIILTTDFHQRSKGDLCAYRVEIRKVNISQFSIGTVPVLKTIESIVVDSGVANEKGDDQLGKKYEYKTNGYEKDTDEAKTKTLGKKEGWFDTTAGVNYGFRNVHQNNLVYLPNLVYTGTNTGVSITVTIRDPNGNVTTPDGSTTLNDTRVVTGGYERIVKGGFFIPTIACKTGEFYTITYSAKDPAGYISVISFALQARDTQSPTIRIGSYEKTAQIGDRISFTAPNITDNIQVTNFELELLEGKGGYFEDDTTYVPSAKGKYYFRWNAADNEGNIASSELMTITVSKDTLPTITMYDTLGASFYPGEGVEKPRSLDQVTPTDPESEYVAIQIPYFFAEDAVAQKVTLEVTISVNGTDIPVKKVEVAPGVFDETIREFVPISHGKYIVTYTATDEWDNVATFIRTLAVGDVENPIIIIKDEKANKPGNQKINATITLNLSTTTGVQIWDENGEFDTDYFYDANGKWDKENGQARVRVIVRGPSGTALAATNDYGNKFKLENVGTYTIEYSIRDKAGNPETIRHSFEVTEKKAKTTTSSIVWGTILIVVSLGILAFIVWKFLGGKSIKGKGKTQKKEKPEKEEKIVV